MCDYGGGACDVDGDESFGGSNTKCDEDEMVRIIKMISVVMK